MENLISVIVPIYNVERYLPKCIESILNQTYKDLEIILVNDGSTDSSLNICQEYMLRDDRIKIVNKKNGGLSSARNAGLEIASGKYISFIDSDDFIHETMYEKMISLNIRCNTDICICDYYTFANQEFCGFQYKDENSFFEIMDKEEVIKRYLLGNWIAAWDKLYKRSLFDNLKFPEGILNEDEAIMLFVFDKCNKICYLNEKLYYYLRREGSITTSISLKNNLHWIENSRKNLFFIRNNYPLLIEEAQQRYYSSIIWTLHTIGYNRLKKYSNEKKYLKRLLLKDINKVLCNKYIKISRKFAALFLVFSVSIYGMVRSVFSNIKKLLNRGEIKC